MRRHTAADDRGLTLIELLISIVIMGIVGTAISGSLAVVLRTDGQAAGRLDESAGAQGLTTYFTQDAESATSGDTSIGAQDAPDCTLPPAEVPGRSSSAMRLRWSETLPGQAPASYYVTYRFEPIATDWTVVRYACTGTNLVPTRLVVARNLQAPPAGWTGTTQPPAVQPTTTSSSVTLRLMARSGYQYSVTAARLVPPAATPCTATGSASPSAVSLTAAPPSGLPAVTVSATATGTCASPLTVTYAPDGVTEQSATLSAAGTSGSTVLSGGAWTPGTRTLTFKAGSVEVGTASLRVDGCDLTVAASPSSVELSGSGLKSDVVVTATAVSAALCAKPLTLTFTNTASGAASSVPMTGSGPFTATISKAGTWAVGTSALEVRQATGDPRAFTGSFSVTPASCAVSGTAVSTGSVQLTSGSKLPAGVVVSGSQTGCTSLQVEYPTTAGSKTVTATVSGATWSATLPTSDVWTAGTATVRVLDASKSPAADTGGRASFTVVAAPACSISAMTANPTSITINNSNRKTTTNVDFTVTVANKALCTAPALAFSSPPATAAARQTASETSTTFVYRVASNLKWDTVPSVTATFTGAPGITFSAAFVVKVG